MQRKQKQKFIVFDCSLLIMVDASEQNRRECTPKQKITYFCMYQPNQYLEYQKLCQMEEEEREMLRHLLQEVSHKDPMSPLVLFLTC